VNARCLEQRKTMPMLDGESFVACELGHPRF
jgi:hypothetical protein